MENDRKEEGKLIDFLKKGESFQKQIIELADRTGMNPLTVIAAKKLHDSLFRKYNRPDYAITPGLYCYELLKETLPREILSFRSQNAELRGYYYKVTPGKGLIVLVHGFHAGADDYLPIVEYFVKKHFCVFSYDGTGTYDSEGNSTVGMCQGLVDLDHALRFVEKHVELSQYPLFLVGHSCGGYAVTSSLSLHKNVKACLGIAAVNNCSTLILDKGWQYGGEFATGELQETFIKEYQKMLFGKYTTYSGVKGINDSGIPVLIAHGDNDRVISFYSQGVIAHRNEITNPNVKYYIGSDEISGHDSIWHSARSEIYRKKVDKKMKDLDREEKIALMKRIDHRLYSEINFELFDQAIGMFESCLKG